MSRQTPDLRQGLRAALDGAAAERERQRLKQAFDGDARAREHAEELRQVQAEPALGLSLDAHEEAKDSVRSEEVAADAPAPAANGLAKDAAKDGGAKKTAGQESREPRPVTQPVLLKPPAMLARASEEETQLTDRSRASRRWVYAMVALLVVLFAGVVLVATQKGSESARTTPSAAPSPKATAVPATDTDPSARAATSTAPPHADTTSAPTATASSDTTPPTATATARSTPSSTPAAHPTTTAKASIPTTSAAPTSTAASTATASPTSTSDSPFPFVRPVPK